MTRKYSNELLKKIQQRQEVKVINGIEVLVKNIPDCDEKGSMDPRLYKDSKKMAMMMKLIPKSMMKMDASPKSIARLRKMFNGVKSVPTAESNITIDHIKVKAKDGFDIPIRVYQPENKVTNSPVLFFIHGGGFFGGSPDVIEELVKLIVENENIPAVSVDYRLAPENPYPASHEDCFTVLEWIYENAEAFGGDKNKIVVSGDSAGGNLTQYCTTKDKELGTNMVKAQMLLYPTVNMAGIKDELSEWSLDKYEINQKQKGVITPMLTAMGGDGGTTSLLGGVLGTTEIENPYLSPYMADLTGMPPTLITFGEHDFLMVECMAYAVKLNKAGVKTKTIIYKGFGHAYGDNIGVYPQSEDCAIEMGRFIKENCI